MHPERGLSSYQLPPAKVDLLPRGPATEDKRAALVDENFGKVARRAS